MRWPFKEGIAEDYLCTRWFVKRWKEVSGEAGLVVRGGAGQEICPPGIGCVNPMNRFTLTVAGRLPNANPTVVSAHNHLATRSTASNRGG